ncbi:helix-turn-helix domain-containing protein [Paraburkholderia sp. MM5477-R1]|uniref:helix-turn-helix domain-containing protein n=1 Tax=Paraburkholderia sp. MM5477-R1 TaxID=2991062 RepID=UPI003D1ECB80
MAKKENARQPKSTSAKTKQKFTDNSAEGQRARLLEALKRRALTTIEIRHDLDIMMPAARIFELRHGGGHNIDKVWVSRPTAAGNFHRVALYLYKPQTLVMRARTLDLFPELGAAIAI